MKNTKKQENIRQADTYSVLSCSLRRAFRVISQQAATRCYVTLSLSLCKSISLTLSLTRSVYVPAPSLFHFFTHSVFSPTGRQIFEAAVCFLPSAFTLCLPKVSLHFWHNYSNYDSLFQLCKTLSHVSVSFYQTRMGGKHVKVREVLEQEMKVTHMLKNCDDLEVLYGYKIIIF